MSIISITLLALPLHYTSQSVFFSSSSSISPFFFLSGGEKLSHVERFVVVFHIGLFGCLLFMMMVMMIGIMQTLIVT